MNIYFLKTNTIIEPLNDHVSKSRLRDDELHTFQKQVCEECGLTPIIINSPKEIKNEECIITFDYVVFTNGILNQFVQKCSDQSHTVLSCALNVNSSTEYANPLQDIEDLRQNNIQKYDLYYIKTPLENNNQKDIEQLKIWLRNESKAIVLDFDIKTKNIIRPNLGAKPYSFEFPIAKEVCGHIRHWVHILWVNHQLLGRRIYYYEKEPKNSFLNNLLARFLKTFKNKKLGNKIGEKCDIHPSSYIENSIISDKVKIGANVCIRNSIIGKGAIISDCTNITNSIIGYDCYTLTNTYITWCVAYPGSNLSNIMLSHTLLGKKIFITTGVMYFYDSIKDPIKVLDNGKWRSTGKYKLGGLAGHSAVLGTRAIFQPGRALPNKYVVVMRAEEGVYKVPEQIESDKPYIWEKGRIDKIEEIYPEYNPSDI